MTTTEFPPGIYRISVAPKVGLEDEHSVEPDNVVRQYLTDGGNYVTIRPPNAHPDHTQEWRIEHGKDGNIIISRPSKIWPLPYLTYAGTANKPQPGDRVKLHVFHSPLNEWRRVHAHGHRYFIHVAGSDLGISVAPPKISPPFLDLRRERKLEWVFDFVHK